MAEREGQIIKLAEPGDGPESVDVSRLPHLLGGASLATGSDREAVALQINRVLLAMRGPGHEEAESRVLVAALDEHRFDGLVDAGGRSCRKEAVDTLLACGFPHALKVSPEDLDFARRYKRPDRLDPSAPSTEWEQSLRVARLTGLGVTVAAQLTFLVGAVLFSSTDGAAFPIALVSGLLAAMVALLFATRKPDVDTQAGYGTVLAMLALVQLACGFELGAPALIGGGGVVGGLLASFASQYKQRADPPKPGDWDYTNHNNNF